MPLAFHVTQRRSFRDPKRVSPRRSCDLGSMAESSIIVPAIAVRVVDFIDYAGSTVARELWQRPSLAGLLLNVSSSNARVDDVDVDALPGIDD